MTYAFILFIHELITYVFILFIHEFITYVFILFIEFIARHLTRSCPDSFMYLRFIYLRVY